MKTFTYYGWKTKTVAEKYYLVKSVGKLMLVDNWIECNERMFPNDKGRMRCGLCKTQWRDIPLLESVNCVIFKNDHRNMMVCDKCGCHIKEAMKPASQQ